MDEAQWGSAVIGTELDGRYRILKQLGAGGMGEVYLAEHIHLQRKEALKILRPALAGTPQFVSRFRREARATNRLQHPNIVMVYDFGEPDTPPRLGFAPTQERGYHPRGIAPYPRALCHHPPRAMRSSCATPTDLTVFPAVSR